MATKGPSNLYGKTNGSRKKSSNTDIGYPRGKNFNRDSLKDHSDRHSHDAYSHNTDEYKAKALGFVNSIDPLHNVSFVDRRGTTYKFNKKTREFAIITRKGMVVTYYKLDSYEDYLKEIKKKGKRKK